MVVSTYFDHTLKAFLVSISMTDIDTTQAESQEISNSLFFLLKLTLLKAML